MSARIDKTWLVYDSLENEEHSRCVDLFRRQDGSYGFEEFRRDPEDGGIWTPMAFYSGCEFSSDALVRTAARASIPWLRQGRQTVDVTNAD